ncbi:PucR family transcriptional regulator [Neobacillus niacini]|uniref:PucR family transcriptional regulator n=1 Tax=Neobacillus niacini TaxID=86668 RepID=UPI003B021CA6
MKSAGITVSEILRLPVLKEAKVISGELGMNRVVKYIDIMEVPDVTGWLREGEVLLTTAYAIRHDPTLLPKLVEQLALAEAAALAIKTERFLHDMPIEMIQMSQKYNLPIIQLPNNVPYMDITHAVMEQIIDKQASLLRRSEEIYKTLTTLVVENKGIQAVADKVSGLLRSSMWLVDKTGKTIVSSPAHTPNLPSHNKKFWNINVDKKHEGKLVIDKATLDDVELICVEQARLVFSLELMRRKTAIETENKIRGDFIEELLSGLTLSKEVIINKGNQLGFKPDGEWELAIVEVENDNDAVLIEKISTLVVQTSQEYRIKSHILDKGNRLLLILASQNDEQMKHIGNNVPLHWRSILSPIIQGRQGIRIGFGGKKPLWDIQGSFLEAKRAMMMGSKLNRYHQIFDFEELELFQLLMDATEFVDMDKFVEKKIGLLVDYDKENGTDLVSTLYYYLFTGGSLMGTAKKLFIHRNSVKYRMDRIREIADIDMENFQERFIYYFCIIYFKLKMETTT